MINLVIYYLQVKCIITDEFNKVKIYSEDITYNKNEEIILHKRDQKRLMKKQ